TVDRGAGRHSGMTTALLLILALTACLGFVFLTAWKPVLGCGLFALLFSLTSGLGLGGIVPPALLLFVSRPPDLYRVDTLRNVLAPAQLFLVYLVFSRTPMSEH